MKKLILLLFIPLTLGCGFKSGLTTPANQTFLLGEFNDKNYSAEIINNKIYFGVTNFTDINLVKVYNSNNELESTFEVGLFPGDFAYWEFEEN